MNIKVFVAAVAGGSVATLAGGLLYTGLFSEFLSENAANIHTMRPQGELVLWAILVGNIAWSLLLALVFSRWANIATFMGGATAGAWLTFLMTLGYDMLLYGSMNIFNLRAVLVDPIVNAVIGTISGGVIGWILGYWERKWPGT